jgi:hypothetical protein
VRPGARLRIRAQDVGNLNGSKKIGASRAFVDFCDDDGRLRFVL